MHHESEKKPVNFQYCQLVRVVFATPRLQSSKFEKLTSGAKITREKDMKSIFHSCLFPMASLMSFISYTNFNTVKSAEIYNKSTLKLKQMASF